MREKMSDTEFVRIWNESFTIPQIVERIGCSSDSVYRRKRKLQELGFEFKEYHEHRCDPAPNSLNRKRSRYKRLKKLLPTLLPSFMEEGKWCTARWIFNEMMDANALPRQYQNIFFVAQMLGSLGTWEHLGVKYTVEREDASGWPKSIYEEHFGGVTRISAREVMDQDIVCMTDIQKREGRRPGKICWWRLKREPC